MDILGIFTDYVPRRMAGSEITVHSILAWLAARGHRVRVAVPSNLMPRSLRFDGIDVIPRPSPQYTDALKEADVYFTHLESVEEATQKASKTGKAVIHYAHKDSDLTYNGIVAECLDLVVFNSYGAATEKVRAAYPSLVVYPPVAQHRYDPEAADQGEFTTLVGLNKNKGGDFLQTLAASSSEKFLGVYGSYDKQVKVATRSNLVTEPTTVHIAEIYRKSRVVLLPSHVETFGRVAVEAMWAGVPLIANSECSSPGFREAIGNAAIWAPRSDVKAWVEALEKLRDPLVYREMQDRGLTRAASLHERTEFQLHCLERAMASLVNKLSRRRVHFFASEVHYFRHLSGVCHATPHDMRGLMVVPAAVRREALLEGHRVYTPTAGGAKVIHNVANIASSVAYCVSTTDHTWAYSLGYKVVRAEHGAGQTYKGISSHSYAGSEQHGKAYLCLYPGVHPYRVHTDRLSSPAMIVGSPILDRWIHQPETPAVGFAFHWDCHVCPETKATFHIWMKALGGVIKSLQSKGVGVFFHCHPRYAETFNRLTKDLNVKFISDRDLFLGSITVLVADNTSLIFEAAAHEKMVVVLNSPTYRRDVHHGLRFWVADEVGIPCDDPQDLLSCIRGALDPTDEDVICRDSALKYVYAADQPTVRTVAALMGTILGLPGYDVKGLRDTHVFPVPNTEGLWKLLMSHESEETYVVTKRDTVGEEDFKPGQLVQKSDPALPKLLEQKSVTAYGKEKKAL